MFALVIMAAAVFVSLAAGIFLSIDLGNQAAAALPDPGAGPSLS